MTASGFKVPQVFLDCLLGLTEDEARDRCTSAGLRMRVRRIDGKGMVGTNDFRNDRVNVHLDRGLVTKAHPG